MDAYVNWYGLDDSSAPIVEEVNENWKEEFLYLESKLVYVLQGPASGATRD
jgi:hypothetical protein